MVALAAAISPSNLAVIGGEVYWSEDGAEPLRKVAASGGSPIALAHRMNGVGGLATDAAHAYWLDWNPGGVALVRTALDGSGWTELASGPAAYGTHGPLVLADRLLWTTSVASPPAWMIEAVPLDGGPRTTVVSSTDWIQRLAVDASHVYWLSEPVGGIDSFQTIYRAPLSGGAAELVASATKQAHFGAFAVVGQDVVVGESDGSGSTPRRLVKFPSAGGARTVLGEVSAGTGWVHSLVPNGTSLVWADGSSAYSTPLDGGPTTVVAAATSLGAGLQFNSLVGANGAAYFAALDSGKVWSNGYVGQAGAAATLAGPIDWPTLLAADASGIYWVQNTGPAGVAGSGPIVRIPPGGGVAQPFAAGLSERVYSVAYGPTTAYATDAWMVKSVDLSGGVPREVGRADNALLSLAMGSDAVYALDGRPNAWRIPLDGTPPRVLAMAGFQPGMGRLRHAGDHLYWIGKAELMGPAAVLRMATDGSGQQILVTNPYGLDDIAVDGTHVYFASTDGGIGRVPVDGGPVESFAAATVRYGSVRLEVRSGMLYWADDFQIARRPVAGGPVEILVEAADLGLASLSVTSLASDGTSVYWTERQLGAVMKATPR